MAPSAPIRSQRGASWFFAVIVGAVLAPMVNLWREQPRDSFPFSHYPMFSQQRGTHLEVTYLRGVLSSGEYVALDSRLAANGGMNQERKQIARAARRNRADGLARKTAQCVAKKGTHPNLTHVEVVVGQFPLAAFFDDGLTLPDDVKVVATCPIDHQQFRRTS